MKRPEHEPNPCTVLPSPDSDKLQYNGAWLAAACPLRHQLYRPAVFFHHLRFTALSFPLGEIRNPLQKCYSFNLLLFFFLNCTSLKLGNVKLHWTAVSQLEGCSLCLAVVGATQTHRQTHCNARLWFLCFEITQTAATVVLGFIHLLL